MNVYMKEDEILENVKNKTVLLSHGGVGSEYLAKILGIRYPSIDFRNRFVHFPYPPKGPSQIIYLLRRHP